MNTPILAKRAVIYLRVSTNDQLKTDYDADGFSIRAQREACGRKAEELGAVVVDEYVDRGESAKSADRPELQKMLARLRAESDVDLVIVHKVDRLARSREDDMAIVIAIRKAGAQLVSATENIDATPQGKLLHGIMATIAEFYSANLATESKKGMRQKVMSGGTTGMAPLGYLNTRERIDSGKEVRTVIVDPDRAHHIQWAFEAYASGNWSTIELARVLNERGLQSRGPRGKGNRLIHASTVDLILKNPYYTGVVTFEGVQYPGRHTPLVDPETFEKVQAIMEARAKSREKIHKHPHYLKGSLVCGQCGDRLGVINATGNGGVYPYFYCLGRAKRRTICQFKHVLIDEVERKVELLWQRIHLAPDRIEQIRVETSAQLESVYTLSQDELVRQRRRLAELEKQRAKAKEAYYSDAMSLEDFRGEQRRIAREQEVAERIIEQCGLEIEEIRAAVDEALALFADAFQLYQQASSMIRRQLNQAVFTEFRVFEGGEVRAEIQEQFKALLMSHLPAQTEEVGNVGGEDSILVRAVMASRDEGLGESENRVPPLVGHGSNFNCLVAGTGFEPATSGL